MRRIGSLVHLPADRTLLDERAVPPRIQRRAMRFHVDRANVGGRAGVQTTLTNMSAITGQREFVRLATTMLSDGSTLFVIGVSPQNERSAYQRIFNRVIQGLTINDR